MKGNHRDTRATDKMCKNRRDRKEMQLGEGRGSGSRWSEAVPTAVSEGNGCTSVVLGDHQAQETFFLCIFSLPVNFPQKVVA